MCAGVAGDAEQGGSAAVERRAVDRALCEGRRSAGGGKSTQTVLCFITMLLLSLSCIYTQEVKKFD